MFLWCLDVRSLELLASHRARCSIGDGRDHYAPFRRRCHRPGSGSFRSVFFPNFADFPAGSQARRPIFSGRLWYPRAIQ